MDNNSINNKSITSRSHMFSLLIEPFDGVRKYNARKIFGILLIIIVLDFAIDIFE